MNNQYVVRAKNVRKTFGQNEVIKDLNLSVESQTIYGVLGENGSGKTTIFKLLIGLLDATTGRIEILGQDLTTKRDILLRSIGSLIETPYFYEHLSAKDNLTLHLEYMGLKGINVNNILNKVGLAHTNEKAVSTFSLGMRQRLGIARAFVHKPQLLILDEPTNGLDPVGIREIRDLLLTMVQEERVTILISSHILSEIEHIADKIGVIVDGQIAEEVDVSAVKGKFLGGLEEYFFNIVKGAADR